MKTKWAVVSILLILGIMTGCVMQDDLNALHERIVVLEQYNMDLQRRHEQTKQDAERLRQLVDEYTRKRKEQDEQLRSQSAGLYANLEKMRKDIQALTGRLEETEYIVKRKYQVSMDQLNGRVERIEKYLNMEPSPQATVSPTTVPPANQHPPQVTTPPQQPVEPPIQVPPPPAQTNQPSGSDFDFSKDYTESEIYTIAKQAFDTGSYEKAREGFQTLLKRFPNSIHADNAQFWIGEIYYRQKWYEKAISEYQNVIEKYPEGNKVPSAMLKQAMAFREMGDAKTARLILEDLIKKFPESNESRIADRLLGSL